MSFKKTTEPPPADLRLPELVDVVHEVTPRDGLWALEKVELAIARILADDPPFTAAKLMLAIRGILRKEYR